MAELDRAPEPRTSSPSSGGGLQRKIGPFPVWVWVVGVGGVAIFMYRRSKANAAAAAGAGTNTDTLSAGVPFDSAGAPMGSTGAVQSSQTLDDWRKAAFAALTHAGVSPALAEQALDNFINGNALGPLQSGAINKALGLVGAPPQSLPFNGTVPTSGPTPKPPPVPHWPIDHGFGPDRLSPIAAFPHINLQPGEHVVDVLSTGAHGAGYYLTNLGGVFAVGGAPFLGSAFSTPHAAGTQFTQIETNGAGGYTLFASNGHHMTFAPTKKAA